MAFTVFMQQIPERDSRTVSSHIVSVLQSAVDGTLYLVPRAGGTIVVEKIVAVYSGFQGGSSLSIVLSGVLFPLLLGLTFVARHRVPDSCIRRRNAHNRVTPS